MNDLTELLVFTSAKKALKDPEFLSGELWIDTRARRRLQKETSMIKNVIPWRKKESKDEAHLATVLDNNKSIETFLESRENYLKTEKHILTLEGTNRFYTSSIDNTIINNTFIYSYQPYSTDMSYTPVFSFDLEYMSTWNYNSSYSVIHYSKNNFYKFGSVPKVHMYLLPIGNVTEIREKKINQMESDGVICNKCGKKITKFPSGFTHYPSIGMCVDCILDVEKSHRKLPLDQEILYDGDRYPKGWKKREEDKNPWWLDL